VDAEAFVIGRRTLALCVVLGVALLAALTAGGARAADECKGLRVCLPVTGPWVVAPGGGVDYELACPIKGYVVAGTDARVATADIDVWFRGETGSPVGPGVTTRRSVVFHATRVPPKAATSSFKPFLGCIPTSGGGGRALTAYKASIKPSQALFSVVVNAPIRGATKTVRASCPASAQLLGASSAIAFRQAGSPSELQRGAVKVRRSTAGGAVIARVTATAAAGTHAEVQVRAVCARVR
jgi:hypothetical protein